MLISDWSSYVCSSDLQSIAAVRADIVERLDRPVLGPRDQHRCLRHLDRLDDVTTRLREPLDPSDAEPGALEDTLLLEFEVGGRAIRFGGNRQIGRASCREGVCQYV